MNGIPTHPFAPPLPPGRARAIPWMTVVAGSLVTLVPAVSPLPVLPPAGLLMLLAWRLLARFSLRPWAPAVLGLFDDLVSGQPLGSAAVLWSLCFLGIELMERRAVDRVFRQDWLLATLLIAGVLVLGRLLASPWHAELALPLAAQVAISVLFFPAAAALVGRIDRRRAFA